MNPYSKGHRNPYPNPSANPSVDPYPNPSSNPLARRARGTYNLNLNHNCTYNLTSLSSGRCVVAMAEIGLFGNHQNARATQRPRITT